MLGFGAVVLSSVAAESDLFSFNVKSALLRWALETVVPANSKYEITCKRKPRNCMLIACNAVGLCAQWSDK